MTPARGALAGMMSALAIGLAGSLAGAAVGAEAADGIALPQISITHDAAGSLAISASVVGLADADVSATLKIERNGQGGQASTSQTRTLRLKAGSRETIAETTLNFVPGDGLFVSVTIERNGAIVSRATLAAGDGDEAGRNQTGDRR